MSILGRYTLAFAMFGCIATVAIGLAISMTSPEAWSNITDVIGNTGLDYALFTALFTATFATTGSLIGRYKEHQAAKMELFDHPNNSDSSDFFSGGTMENDNIDDMEKPKRVSTLEDPIHATSHSNMFGDFEETSETSQTHHNS